MLFKSISFLLASSSSCIAVLTTIVLHPSFLDTCYHNPLPSITHSVWYTKHHCPPWATRRSFITKMDFIEASAPLLADPLSTYWKRAAAATQVSLAARSILLHLLLNFLGFQLQWRLLKDHIELQSKHYGYYIIKSRPSAIVLQLISLDIFVWQWHSTTTWLLGSK